MALRVALLGLYHESNTFSGVPTELSDFREKNWLKGHEISKVFRNAHHEIGGMLEVLEGENIEAVPVLFAEATPGGIVSAEAYSALLSEMLLELEKVLPVDGCLVVPHGAAVAASFPDMDGHWLHQVRKRVGQGIPVIGTLDAHANVSLMMAAATDALIAYKTNPHVDQRETGKEAALLLARALRKEVKPVQHFFSLPLAISIEQQHTASEPCKSIYAYACKLSSLPTVCSISVLLGFPYADVPEMGSSLLVITDGGVENGHDVGMRLKEFIVSRRYQLVGTKTDIAAALKEIRAAEKPVLLLDMGDNIGGGSPGNSVLLLQALEALEEVTAFVCVCDPAMVAKAGTHRVGDVVAIDIVTGPEPSANYSGRATLLAFKDGKFRESSPRHGGQVWYNMGMTALLKTEKGNTLMVTSLRVLPFSLQQLLSFDLDPASFDVIVAKGVNAPIAAYGPVCKTIVQVDTPGITQADMTRFEFKHRRKPLFPFEEIEVS